MVQADNKIQVALSVHEDVLPVMPKGVQNLVSLDDSYVAILREDNVIEFLHLSGGTAVFYSRCFINPPENEICSLISLGQGRVMYGCLDGSIGICKLGSPIPIVRLHPLVGGAVFGLSSNLRSKENKEAIIALASQDGSLRLGKVKGDSFKVSKTSDKHSCRLLSVALSPDGSLVASGTADGLVRIYKPSNSIIAALKCIKQFKVPNGKEGINVNSLLWLNDWIVAGDSLGQVTFWPGDLDNVNATSFKSHLADILCLVNHKDEKGFLSVMACGIDHRMVQFVLDNNEKGTWNKRLSRRICNHDVRGMAIIGSKYLISGSADGVVKMSHLSALDDKTKDYLYSALPFFRDIKSKSAFIETGRLHLLNDNACLWAIMSLNDSFVIDHAVNDKFACVATSSSLKFFSLSPQGIEKCISFENLILNYVCNASEENENSFVGLSIDNEMWMFEVIHAENVFKKKVKSFDLIENEFVTCFIAKSTEEFALGMSSGKVIVGASSFECNSIPLLLYLHDGILMAYLENHSLLLVKDGQKRNIIKCPQEMKHRPIRGILHSGHDNVYLMYNESFCYSLRPSFNNDDHVESVWMRVNDFPNHTILLTATTNDNGNQLRAVTRPWEHVLSQLTPAFETPKYGFK